MFKVYICFLNCEIILNTYIKCYQTRNFTLKSYFRMYVYPYCFKVLDI